MDNFSIIYKMLSALEKSMDCESFDIDRISPDVLRISQERWNKYVEMLVDAGYVKGVSVKRYTDGALGIKLKDTPKMVYHTS